MSAVAIGPASRDRGSVRVRRMAERLASLYRVPGELSYTMRVQKDGALAGLLDGTPWAASLDVSGNDGLSVYSCPAAEVRGKTWRGAFRAIERALGELTEAKVAQ